MAASSSSAAGQPQPKPTPLSGEGGFHFVEPETGLTETQQEAYNSLTKVSDLMSQIIEMDILETGCVPTIKKDVPALEGDRSLSLGYKIEPERLRSTRRYGRTAINDGLFNQAIGDIASEVKATLKRIRDLAAADTSVSSVVERTDLIEKIQNVFDNLDVIRKKFSVKGSREVFGKLTAVEKYDNNEPQVKERMKNFMEMFREVLKLTAELQTEGSGTDVALDLESVEAAIAAANVAIAGAEHPEPATAERGGAASSTPAPPPEGAVEAPTIPVAEDAPAGPPPPPPPGPPPPPPTLAPKLTAAELKRRKEEAKQAVIIKYQAQIEDLQAQITQKKAEIRDIGRQQKEAYQQKKPYEFIKDDYGRFKQAKDLVEQGRPDLEERQRILVEMERMFEAAESAQSSGQAFEIGGQKVSGEELAKFIEGSKAQLEHERNEIGELRGKVEHFQSVCEEFSSKTFEIKGEKLSFEEVGSRYEQYNLTQNSLNRPAKNLTEEVKVLQNEITKIQRQMRASSKGDNVSRAGGSGASSSSSGGDFMAELKKRQASQGGMLKKGLSLRDFAAKRVADKGKGKPPGE